MKISYNWLKEIIGIQSTPQQLEELLTGCGLEVESVEPYESIKGGLEGIVIGQVKTCEKHPNADKLKITTVDIGTGTDLPIVCGAPNVAAGQKVLVAPVGCIVNPMDGEPFEIKKAKIRGEVSEGMICAEDELSLGRSHDGILVMPDHAAVGEKATNYFDLYHDYTLEIGLTANRGDAASHLGVARDLHALTGSLIQLKNHDLPSMEQFPVSVEIRDTDCKRYSGVLLTGIKVGDSPDWIKNRLRAIGINPINNVVDATNYVLHELGQPLHAFDADKIAGKKIIVQKVAAGTSFTTLDKTSRTLNGTECMICDMEKPLAIGGVFGGLSSGITDQTTSIFIESAYFEAGSIRKTAKFHGLSTDASFRYERGTDPEITITALKRVVSIILEIAGGTISSGILDLYPEPINPVEVSFSLQKLERLIGQPIPEAEVKRILTALEIEIISEENQTLQLRVPAYRSDVRRFADVAEEVLRIYGLNKIAIPEQLKSTIAKSNDEQAFLLRNKVADYLSSNGFTEMLSNSLTKSAYYDETALANAVKVMNPLSNDLDMMRLNMLFNGLEMIQYNANRKNSDIKAYEFGLTYQTNATGKYEETAHFTLFMTGQISPESWLAASQSFSYYSIKTAVIHLLKRLGLQHLQFDYDISWPHLHHATKISMNSHTLGVFGEVDPKQLKQFDIEQPVYFADINWNVVKQLCANLTFSPQQVSPFPAVRRDLAMVVEQQVKYADMERIALKTAPELIRQINVFDVYQGDKIEKGKKSYALSFVLQDDRKTLQEQDIDGVMKKLIGRLEKELGAKLRM